jgi:hypothetical protein
MTTRDRLKTPPHWNALHQHTYEAIFRNPAAHDLEWHDVRSLLTGLANVAEGHNGSLEVTRNGQLLILHAPKHKEFATAEELLAIRRLLEQSGEAAIPPPAALGADLLVVIDHHIEETDGKRRPEQKSFYEAVASTLRGANRILIFGSGTGESSAMGQLLADLKHNHIDVAKHIVGSIVIDGHHLTEGQLLAQAREVFASRGD